MTSALTVGIAAETSFPHEAGSSYSILNLQLDDQHEKPDKTRSFGRKRREGLLEVSQTDCEKIHQYEPSIRVTIDSDDVTETEEHSKQGPELDTGFISETFYA